VTNRRQPGQNMKHPSTFMFTEQKTSGADPLPQTARKSWKISSTSPSVRARAISTCRCAVNPPNRLPARRHHYTRTRTAG